jgi:site-specific DNA-methyltransferase (adenine-specific)
MKALSERTHVSQVLANRKGITWLDDGRIPYRSEDNKENARVGFENVGWKHSGNTKDKITKLRYGLSDQEGRFPANLLVSDDVLNTGKHGSRGHYSKMATAAGSRHVYAGGWRSYTREKDVRLNDAVDSFSRYFDLDAWFRCKFIITPKASRSEREAGGIHPTIKPIKLFSYLISIGSRPRDVVLDPFIGTGTTALAARMLGRHYIGVEINPKYIQVAKARLAQPIQARLKSALS